MVLHRHLIYQIQKKIFTHNRPLTNKRRFWFFSDFCFLPSVSWSISKHFLVVSYLLAGVAVDASRRMTVFPDDPPSWFAVHPLGLPRGLLQSPSWEKSHRPFPPFDLEFGLACTWKDHFQHVSMWILKGLRTYTRLGFWQYVIRTRRTNWYVYADICTSSS